MGRPSDRMREQHVELVNLVKQISGQLTEAQLGTAAKEVATLLGRFSGKLQMHLAAEDNSLYPRMTQSKDDKAKATAQKFQTEMGGLKSTFVSYVGRWDTEAKIKANPKAFIDETKKVFAAIGERVNKEETVLYQIYDTMAA